MTKPMTPEEKRRRAPALLQIKREAIKHAQAKRRTHGLSGSRTYKAWANMLTRCANPKHDHYRCYGALGVVVCEKWKRFANFLHDMGVCPDGYSIERIDVFGNYEPGNCTWIPLAKQGENTRASVQVQLNGKAVPLATVAKLHGILPRVARQRVKKLGWDVLRAATEPVHDTRNNPSGRNQYSA